MKAETMSTANAAMIGYAEDDHREPDHAAAIQSQAARRWVSFQTRSLASVQGTRTPM